MRQRAHSIEILIAKDISYMRKTTCYIHRKHFIVVFASPTAMLLNIVTLHFTWLVVSGHAPHAGWPNIEIAEWRDNLYMLIKKYRELSDVRLLVDA